MKRHYDHATLMKKTFNCDDLLAVSEVQSIFIMTDRIVVCKQTYCWLHLDQKATEKWTETLNMILAYIRHQSSVPH